MSTTHYGNETSLDFCFGTYRGRDIATFRYGPGWVVYLDKIMQTNALFATASDAISWLRSRIDYQAKPAVRQSRSANPRLTAPLSAIAAGARHAEGAHATA
jgi:hypothetical protein